MSETSPICRSKNRRHQVRQSRYNGLDYLEVSPDQRTLTVYFLGRAPAWLDENEPKENKQYVRISGGRRIRDIQVQWAKVVRAGYQDQDDCLEVRVDKPGDFSVYTLCLENLPDQAQIDPRYACLDFSFKVDCPSDLDCLIGDVCLPPIYDEPEIDYLSKDYASFRRLIFDRLALVMSEWQEQHVPDIGVALVELLAYAGDYLSYYQDAVATEAYLETARQRISVRRHARLVDYHMHEGCNARAFVCVEVDDDLILDVEDTMFVTDLRQVEPLSGRILSAVDLDKIPSDQYEVFEPLVDTDEGPIKLYKAHNHVTFYTWGDRECCLPVGTTTAWLVAGPAIEEGVVEQPDVQQTTDTKYPPDNDSEGSYQWDLQLQEGDFLIFEEVKDPRTGNPADANPAHRHVVRLKKVEKIVDELNRQPLLEITWAEEDALPFPLCISAISAAPDCQFLDDISIACGNVILVDHGHRIDDEDLGCVPVSTTEADCECGDRLSDVRYLPGIFRPRLTARGLTFRQPLTPDAAAASLKSQDPRWALPWIRLVSFPDPECWPDSEAVSRPEGGQIGDNRVQVSTPAPKNNSGSPPITSWTAQRDLLGSQAGDPHFVIEMDDRRSALLRFGDGELGRQPDAYDRFQATYRRGNGPVGNVGAETITHLVYRQHQQGGISRIRNPLAASGGVDPEPVQEVKLFAPYAFQHELKRAITADDYAQIVMRDFPNTVQRTAASLRWMGSWYEVLVAVDVRGQSEADPQLLREIKEHLYRYRRVGHDLVVVSAQSYPYCWRWKFVSCPHICAAMSKPPCCNCLATGNCVTADSVSSIPTGCPLEKVCI
jgi:hypothetical protein